MYIDIFKIIKEYNIRMKTYIKILNQNNISITEKQLKHRSSKNNQKKLLSYDVENVIMISRFILSKTKVKKVAAGTIVSHLEADYWLRTCSWILIRRIEEKLTAALQQKFAFDKTFGEDYYLKISNFKSEIKGNKNKQIRYKKELSRYMNDLKVFQHNKLFNSSDEFIQKNDYYPFSKLLSIMSYTQKVKLLKFMKEEDVKLVLESFGISNNLWVFEQVRYLRNQAAHHGLLINKEFKSYDKGKTKTITISELISVMKRLSSPTEAKKFMILMDSVQKESTKNILIEHGLIKV